MVKIMHMWTITDKQTIQNDLQKLKIENKELKQENERLKKLVFNTDDEKDLIIYSILMICKQFIDKYECDKDNFTEDDFKELENFVRIYSNLR